MFTKEDFLTIANLAEPGEIIPLYALLASRLGKVTKEDIEWARSIK